MPKQSIEKVSLAVQIGGKPYFVLLDQDRLQVLVKMAQGLSDNGQLNVARAPEHFTFTTVVEAIQNDS